MVMCPVVLGMGWCIRRSPVALVVPLYLERRVC